MDKRNFTIGQLAKAADVNVETVRYYHRIGLLPTPERPYGSIRHYSSDSLQRLRFIKRAQRLGFTLEEILSLLVLADGTHCPETKTLAEQKLALVRQKIADLSTIEFNLHSFIDACSQTNSGQHGCPMIGCAGSTGMMRGFGRERGGALLP